MRWLLIFLVTLSACASKRINNQQAFRSPAATELTARKFPDKETWERWYKILDDHTKLANFPSLRTADLANGDIEVRVWYSVSFRPMQCVMLKRIQNEWSGIYLKSDKHYPPTAATTTNLKTPLSDWEPCWNELQQQGLTVFPEVIGQAELDGSGYFIEVREGELYKPSVIMNPENAKEQEGSQMLKISNILAREFQLPGFDRSKDR